MESRSILTGRFVDQPALTFFEQFRQSAENNADRKAVIFHDQSGIRASLTFATLDQSSNRLARLLQRLCRPVINGKDNLVLICARPSEKLPVILLSVLKAGMSYLPIDREFSLQRKQYILREAQPLLVILDEDVASDSAAELFSEFQVTTPSELINEAKSESAERLDEGAERARVPIVLYTSGSTGVPKGVRLSYTALMNRISWQWRRLPYAEDEVNFVAKTALTFVDSVSEIWSPLLQGRTLVVVPKETSKDPEQLLKILESYRIGRIVLVPSLLKSMLMYLKHQPDKYPLDALKLWVCSGETLQTSVISDFFGCFKSQGRVLANFYGSTEVMGDVTYHLFRETDPWITGDKAPIGMPLDNCIAYIVNQDLEIVPRGEVGELLISGSNLAQGYIQDSNASKFIDNPFSSKPGFDRVFRTGDHARIVDNVIFYEGRHDSQVKIRGHRIDITELEKAVLQLPMIRDAVVLCDSAAEGNEEPSLLCFVVLCDHRLGASGKGVESELRKALPSYMVPRVIVTDHIPLLTNGKTDRQELLKLVRSRRQTNGGPVRAQYDYTGVPGKLLDKAQVLFPIIAAVIGPHADDLVTFESNFYELGGNSLNSVYTVIKLREQGYNIGIADFIHARSMRDVLEAMEPVQDDPVAGVQDDDPGADEDSEHYVLEMLADEHKSAVIDMITGSFLNKADLEQWLMPDIKRQDYAELMNDLWGDLVGKGLSFVLRSRDSGMIASVALNFDARDEPPVEVKSKLIIIFEFLEHVEGPVLEKRLPPGKGAVFHTFMMATHEELEGAENVVLMRLMEQRCLEIARAKGFKGILTTNTSPLTQQLGTDIFKYEVMDDFQVNRYIHKDGTRPFGEAPDSQRAVCSWKSIAD